MNRVYISGPISGIKEENREAFMKAEKYIEDSGYIVVNPIKLGDRLKEMMYPAIPKWEDYMVECIVAMIDCKIIVMLEGWESSRGAKMERAIAINRDMVVTTVDCL